MAAISVPGDGTGRPPQLPSLERFFRVASKADAWNASERRERAHSNHWLIREAETYITLSLVHDNQEWIRDRHLCAAKLVCGLPDARLRQSAVDYLKTLLPIGRQQLFDDQISTVLSNMASLRADLLSPESHVEVQARVRECLYDVLTNNETITLVEATFYAGRSLSGPEPMTVNQHVALLDALCRASRQYLLEEVRRSQKEQSHEIEKPDSVDLPTGNSTLVVSNSLDSTLIDGDHQNDIYHRRPEIDISSAGLTIFAARNSPDIVDRKLGVLGDLELEDPNAARWLQFVELTGATNDQLAGYFFPTPVEEIKEAIDIALSDILGVDIEVDNYPDK